MYRAIVDGKFQYFKNIREAAEWIEAQPRTGNSATIEKIDEEGYAEGGLVYTGNKVEQKDVV